MRNRAFRRIPQVLALLREHLANMYELSPPENVFALDASKLRAPLEVFLFDQKRGLCRLRLATRGRRRSCPGRRRPSALVRIR